METNAGEFRTKAFN